jgi:hypothetical protein
MRPFLHAANSAQSRRTRCPRRHAAIRAQGFPAWSASGRKVAVTAASLTDRVTVPVRRSAHFPPIPAFRHQVPRARAFPPSRALPVSDAVNLFSLTGDVQMDGIERFKTLDATLVGLLLLTALMAATLVWVGLR